MKMNIDDIIKYNTPYNKNNLDALIEEINKNNIVPFIGAGLSILNDKFYPSWNSFLYSTFGKYFPSQDKKEFDALDFEGKAEYLYNDISKMTFGNHLKEVFGSKYIDDVTVDFTYKPIYLLPTIFKNSLLLTTNYDKVIEKVYSLHKKTLTVARPGQFEALNSALRSNLLLLYKIHGDISEPIETIILTKDQYDKAYSDAVLNEALNNVFKSKSMLFLGCSLNNDRYLETLCKVSSSGMSNFAIIPCDIKDIKSRRLDLENNKYIQSIIYPDNQHECVFEILKYISEKINNTSITTTKKSTTFIDTINLDNEWFSNQNSLQINNLGDRYSPELNITLEVNLIFDALSRNNSFYERFISKTDNLITKLKKLKFNEIHQNISTILETIKQFRVKSIEKLNISKLECELNKINDVVEDKKRYYLGLLKTDTTQLKYDNALYNVRKAINLLYDYLSYIQSDEVKSVNSQFILLYGEGGIGKSHLIADVINQRKSCNKKSLLLLGQQFKNNEPVKEMMSILDLDIDFKVLLSKLNSIGENDNSRVFIFIDALNEGNGKNIWNEYLPQIVELINGYPWVGLVVSIRTEYLDLLFEEQSKLKESFISIQHNGFSKLEHKAIKQYFNHYNIQSYDIPLAEHEFTNPLFVRLFCEGFKDSSIDLSKINFTDIYCNYFKKINSRMALSCNFSKRINIVYEVVRALVKFKYSKNNKSNLIPISDVTKIIVEIKAQYNIQNPLLDELTSNGILTQSLYYSNDEYINITYEKLEDYLYGQNLVAELYSIGIDNFKENHKDLIYYPDILEALAIVLSEKNEYELFELFETDCNDDIVLAFCRALKWRKATKLNSKVHDYINKVIIRNEYGFEVFYEQLVFLCVRISHDLNADKTVKNVLLYKMPDRDAKFIPLFDRLFEESGSCIDRILDWCLSKDNNNNVLDETIRLASIMITTFLISSNNLLRDKSTKALINILTGKIDILLSVLKTYQEIDDPYVLERLYAVAFGCVMSERDTSKIKKLALYVYDEVFNLQQVYPNILLRDYAKNIIDYAKYKCDDTKLNTLKILLPFKSKMPKVPTDNEIEKYKYDYNIPSFKKYYCSQNKIIRSMQVEYGRDGSLGGYGDFGRYIFQHYFSNWENLNYNDLSNIAIKRVFDLGYDVEKHGRYDQNIKDCMDRNPIHERIGKKYQWIALYELAAQVADNHKLKVHIDEHGSTIDTYCMGAFEPDIRNIDTTILSIPQSNKSEKVIHDKIYSIPDISHTDWLQNFNDFPNIEKIIKLNYKNSDYILLNGGYSWNEDKMLGENRDDIPYKNIWMNINSYIVKREHLQDYINALSPDKVDFMGRWAAEPSSNSTLYNKEYYWSEGFKFFNNAYYGGEEWTDFDKYSRINSSFYGLPKVLIPSIMYYSERSGDNVNDNSVSWYKPCSELFDGLKLSYSNNNTILYDRNGKIACFDSEELLNEDIGFFFEYKSLQSFLKSNGYAIFGSVLAEKRIIQNSFSIQSNYAMPHLSGFFYYDDDNNIIYTSNQYDE